MNETHMISNVEKRKKLAAMLRGNDAMKNDMFIKLNRIALISIAVAALMACSPLTAFAAVSSALPADTSTKVIYNGNGTTKSVTVQNADNLDTFKDLMPNGTTKPQNIVIQNKSAKKMQVYFRAVPTADNTNNETSQLLLNTLNLKITFKMDNNTAPQTLYEGLASGKTGATTVKDIVTNPISLGYVYENSDSGVISATLSAPETMGNQFHLSSAKIIWEIQFELANPTNPGGNSGGGGGTISEVSSQPTENIDTESTPKIAPASSSPATETIVNGDVPLSKPPKTGENAILPFSLLAIAVVAGLVFVITKRKMKADSSKKS
jgi:LPXTG-motif cell wall-anchored protein